MEQPSNPELCDVESRARGIVCDACNAEFGMGERVRKTRYGNLCRGHERPVAAAGDEPCKNAGIVCIIGDGEWGLHKIVECRRRTKRRDDPPLPVFDQAERREMRPARSADGRDNGFPDHRHFAIPRSRILNALYQLSLIMTENAQSDGGDASV